MPINKIANFINYEDELYGLADIREASREKSIYHNYYNTNKFIYKVLPDDYLSKIAERFNVTVALLKNWNNLKSSKIKVEQNLTIFNKTS